MRSRTEPGMRFLLSYIRLNFEPNIDACRENRSVSRYRHSAGTDRRYARAGRVRNI